MSLLTTPPGWTVIDGHHLHKVFLFPDFVSALAFVNKVGAIAEAQAHHPDVALTWGKAEITTWTHSSNSLTEKDYTLAAAIDRIL